MESDNPTFVSVAHASAAVEDSVEIERNINMNVANLNIVAEFEDLFQTVTRKNKEESPLMEQANVLMQRGVMELDQDDDIEAGGESIKLGNKIARSAARSLQGRQPTLMDEVDKNCCSCFQSPANSLSFEARTDDEYNRLMSSFPTLAKQLEGQQNSIILHLKRFLFNNDEMMRLLSEFIWRHPSMTAFTMEHDLGMFGARPLLLSHALANNPNLKMINFNYTDASVEFTASMALVARFAKELETVTLAHTEVKDTGAMFWGLALSRGAPKLRYLDLSGGGIRSRGAIALAIGVRNHQSLRVLNLSENRISRVGCMKLGEALVENPLLEELNLSGNAIGSRGACAVAAFMTHPNTRLQTLLLARNDIGPKGGKALAVGLSMNKSLKHLVLSKNDLGDDGCAGFGHALETNGTLEILDFTDNDITDLGAAAIAKGLKMNTALKVLNLSNEVIRDAGAQAIARCLEENQGLQVLHLEQNAIADQGGEAFAEMLPKNTTLQELKLNDNEIANSGAIALAKVLIEKQNRNLQVLDLTNNPISSEVSRKWLSAAESRVVTCSTERIDVVAAGTAIARGNLREFGVVVIRTRTSGFIAVVMIFLTLFISWFDFISDLIVISNEVNKVQENAPGASIVYVALTSTFVALPFFYILFMFSVPADETDVTLPAEAIQGAWGSESIRKHMHKVRKSRCSQERFALTLLNVFQMRLAYEIYLSWKYGLTTLAFSSIRLVEVVFEALPQSIVQLHIILSSATLLKIKTGLTENNGVDRGDTTALILLISVTISVATLSRTMADLFEKRYVVNWKRNAFHHEELAMALGMILAFLYHLFHYSMRALTIALACTIYHGIVCAIAFVVLCLVRVILGTGSERRKSFAVVSFFVGSASWDGRLQCRVAHFLETLEMLAVIIPLWIPLPLVQEAVMQLPLMFQQEWIPLIAIGTSPILTGILGCCWLLSLALYFVFIERIHLYSDVRVKAINLDAADRLAMKPFEDNARAIRNRRREKLMMGGGEKARYGELMNHVGFSNSSHSAGIFRTLFGRSGKSNRTQDNAVVSSSSNRMDDGPVNFVEVDPHENV